jgi:hypothetical protein
LCTFTYPEFNTIVSDAQGIRCAFSRNGIVKPHSLNETTITAIARISNHYIEEGAITRTTSRKTNDYHVLDLLEKSP